MNTHKKDLERHPALTGGPNGKLHDIIVAVDPAPGGRQSIFIDGREIIVSTDDIVATWSEYDLPRVSIDILAEDIEVISWDEMEKRAY